MKRKYANKGDWDRIMEREFRQKYMDADEYKGYITLIVMKKFREPLIASFHSHQNLCLADDGFMWLQYFPKDANHCATVMFNPQQEAVLCYIDIAKPWQLSDEGIPYFDDLYLDVIVMPRGDCYLLDEDELHEALQEGIITAEEAELAEREATQLMSRLHTGELLYLNRAISDLQELLQTELWNGVHTEQEHGK